MATLLRGQSSFRKIQLVLVPSTISFFFLHLCPFSSVAFTSRKAAGKAELKVQKKETFAFWVLVTTSVFGIFAFGNIILANYNIEIIINIQIIKKLKLFKPLKIKFYKKLSFQTDQICKIF